MPAFDINTLRSFSVANDRVGYWSYLGQFDAYGRLAAGVATNETTAGYIGNSYFSSVYHSATGQVASPDLLRTIGTDLMRRDLAAREANIGESGTGLNLRPGDIADYHQRVFSDRTFGAVGYEGWTPWAPLRDAIQSGDTARADRIWAGMLEDSTVSNGWLGLRIASNLHPAIILFGNPGDVRMSAVEAAIWLADVVPAATAAQGAGIASLSFRNLDRIDGWSRSTDGTWHRVVAGTGFDALGNITGMERSLEFQTADATTAARLEGERDARAAHYGNNVIRVSELDTTVTLPNGTEVAISGTPENWTATVEREQGDGEAGADLPFDRLELRYVDGQLVQSIEHNGDDQTVTTFRPDGTREHEVTYDADDNLVSFRYFDADDEVEVPGSPASPSLELDFDDDGDITGGAENGRILTPADVLGTLGSSIGGLLGGDNFGTRIIGQTVGGTFAGILGQTLTNVIDGGLTGAEFTNSLTTSLSGSLEGVGASLLTNGLGNLRSGISSLLIGELADALNLEGFGAVMFNAAGTAVTNQLLLNAQNLVLNGTANGLAGFEGLVSGFASDAFFSSMSGSVGGALGSYLAHQVYTVQSQYGSIGGTIGGAIGSILGSFIPIPFLGSAIGNFFGTLMGSVIGDFIQEAYYPDKAWAGISLDVIFNDVDVVDVNKKREGNTSFIESILNAQEEAIEDIVAGMHGTISGAASTLGYWNAFPNANLVRFYDRDGTLSMSVAEEDGTALIDDNIFVVHTGEMVEVPAHWELRPQGETEWVETYFYERLEVRSRQEAMIYAVDAGGAAMLRNLRFSDGDALQLYALENSTATTLSGLLAELQVARDYSNFLQRQGEISSIMRLTPDSAFSVGWALTLLRAGELGLHNVQNHTFWGDASNNTILGFAGNDRIWGGDGDDTIEGGAGDDRLDGGAGNDTLDGGTGTNSLYGGAGNDVYVVDDASDIVIEAANEGTDTIQTSLAAFSLGINVENLTYTGTGSFNGVGNELDNVITGGSGNDILLGGAGRDGIRGGAGNDFIYFDANDDLANVLGGEGDDLLYISSGSAPVTFELAAHGFERAQRYLTDTGSADWSFIDERFDSGWNMLTQSIWNDIGTRHVTEFDVAGAYTWSSHRLEYAASGSVVAEVYTQDGTGSYTRTEWDVSNANTWGVVTTDFLISGVRVRQRVDYDDRRFNVQEWGANGVVTATAYNASGVRVSEQITQANGAYDLTEWDVAGAQAWQSRILHFSNPTTVTSIEIVWDNGQREIQNHGNVTETGDALDNVIVTYSGNDSLSGGAGNDRLSGGDGNDWIDGGTGNDRLDGGAGNDTIIYDAADTAAFVTGGTGTDTLLVINQTTPTNFNLAASGFENARIERADVNNNQAWQSILETYNSAWLVTSSLTIFDNQSQRSELFDPDMSNPAWASINTLSVMVQGELRISTQNIIRDNGTRDYYTYDYDVTTALRSTLQNYNAQGQLTLSRLYNDDGSYRLFYYDPSNAYSWNEIHEYHRIETYARDGIRQTVRQFNDDGTSDYQFDDTSNQFNYSRSFDRFDALGRRTENTMTFDASQGGHAVRTLYDHSAAINWSSSTTYSDAAGNSTRLTHILDNGTWSDQFWDTNNSQAYSNYINYYDAQDRMTEQQYYRDDGSLIRTWWDAANTQPWNQITNTYGANGSLLSSVTV